MREFQQKTDEKKRFDKGERKGKGKRKRKGKGCFFPDKFNFFTKI